MFCKNCGKELADVAKFCDGCGSPVVAEQQAPAAPEQPAPAAPKAKASGREPPAEMAAAAAGSPAAREPSVPPTPVPTLPATTVAMALETPRQETSAAGILIPFTRATPAAALPPPCPDARRTQRYPAVFRPSPSPNQFAPGMASSSLAV